VEVSARGVTNTLEHSVDQNQIERVVRRLLRPEAFDEVLV